jgi:hypothetical protein
LRLEIVTMRTRRWVIETLMAVCMSVLGELSLSAQAPTDRDATAPSGRDIAGTWEGTFRLDSAWRLPERATAQMIPARLVFNPVGDSSPTTSSPRSVHPGTFEIDFSRFGFSLSTREALGWSTSPDSMRATLNPTVDHGVVEVHGTVRGDTIVGTWRYTSDPGGAAGTFEIRKRSNR